MLDCGFAYRSSWFSPPSWPWLPLDTSVLAMDTDTAMDMDTDIALLTVQSFTALLTSDMDTDTDTVMVDTVDTTTVRF